MRLTTKLFKVSLLLFVSFVLVMSCSDSPTSTENNDNNGERITDQPISELPGDEDESVVKSTYDLTTPYSPNEQEISTIDDGEGEQKVLRTEIEIAVDPNTSTGQLNSFLDKYDAEIVDMLEGIPHFLINIPDPGNYDELNKLIENLESESIIEYTLKSYLIGKPKLKYNDLNSPDKQKIPSNMSKLDRIDHHMAIRANGAWNLDKIMSHDESAPWVIVVDTFGDGMPAAGYNANFESADFATGRTHSHGYHVLGIIAGQFQKSNQLNDDKLNDVTGGYPNKLNVRVIDTEDFNFLRAMGDIVDMIKEIRKKDSDAKIIVNTSFGWEKSNILNETYAFHWISKVRSNGLEDKFIHFSSAGNMNGNSKRYDAKEKSPFNFAGLDDPQIRVGVIPITRDRLKNTFVVENRIFRDSDEIRPKAGCGFFDTILGGNLSAIGTNVYSFGKCTYDSNGDCNQHQSATSASYKTGTSMSSPQAASVAALIWGINPQLSVEDVRNIISQSSVEIQPVLPPVPICVGMYTQPVIDAYAAVLAAGGKSARKSLLDVDENGVFDEKDVQQIKEQHLDFEKIEGVLEKEHYDLNGSGFTGNIHTERFDLDDNLSFNQTEQLIAGTEVQYNEESVSNSDIVCYYSYSDLFEGDEQERDELLEGICYEGFTKPVVTTHEVENVTSNSAEVIGEVTDDGGRQVTTRGVCWSTSEDPSTNDECTSNGEGTGRFSSTLTDLNPETEYFVRAFATNSEGTSYGVQRDFITTEESQIGLVLDPKDLLIEPGSSQITEATVSRTNFDGEVTLSVVSSLPSGVTAEIDQPGTGNTGSIEFLLVEGHETFEDYEVEIQASGEGVNSVKDGVYLNIERVGELSLSMDPTDLLIEPGSSQTTEATVSRTNYEGEVTLRVVSSLPSGVTADIDQPGTGNSGSVEFLLDEDHETFEDYEVEIQASGEGVKSVRDEVYLNIERVGELSLRMDPTDLLIEPGSSQTTEATVSRTNFEGEITLSVLSSLPSGVTTEIDQPGSGDTGSVEFLLDESHESFEDYEVEIQASGEGVKSVKDEVYLNIERVGELSLSMDPTDLLIEPGSSQTTEATLSRTNFEGEVTLSVVSSLPSGVTADIDQPGSGDSGSVEFLLDESHESFEDYEVEIQASGKGVKSVKDEVYLNIEEQVSKPYVTTESISSITENSAVSGGDVTEDGGADVTERGVCWDTSEEPTLDDQCTSDGEGTGNFESEITELNPDTKYYVRAYAINSEGTSYGNQQDFRTEDVQTYSIFGVVAEDDGTSIEGLDMLLIRHDQDSNLSTSTDNSGYYIFENLRAGDDYSVAPQSSDEFEPTNQRFDNLSSNQSQDFVRVPETYSISGTVFDSEGQEIEGLDMLLIRHDQGSNLTTKTDNSGDYIFEQLRAGDDYTVTPQSTDEYEPTNQRFDNLQSDQIHDFVKVDVAFSCGDTVKDADGNEYETVQIGNQCWITRSLRTTKYNDGSSIANIQDATVWSNTTNGAWVNFENDPFYGEAYGKLYNWYAVDNNKGICPINFKAPSESEWQTLIDFIATETETNNPVNVLSLRSCRQIDSPYGEECNTEEHPRWEWGSFGTDEYGLGLLPGGRRYGVDTSLPSNWYRVGIDGQWWTSTEIDNNNSVYLRFESENDHISNGLSSEKQGGMSVRCILVE